MGFIERQRKKKERDLFSGIGSPLQGLTCPKSARQASRMEIPAEIDVAVSIPKAVWMQNCFLSSGPLSLLLRSSTDWMRPAYIMEGNLRYLKSTD